MTTTATPSQQQVPASVGKQAAVGIQQYAVRVRRARRLLQFLFWTIIVTGLLTTVISFFAVSDTLGRYQKIVADSAISADAAQEARSALLAYHSAAADFLSLKASPDDQEAAEALQRSTREWFDYQNALRRFWRNKEQNRSDAQFGENEVFSAADSATWRYKADIDAMIALVEIGEAEAAERLFLQSDQTLRREVIPALNGLEDVKLESMEEAYATTNAAISSWQQALMFTGGLTVLLLIIGFGLTRFWLHYAWTWELAIASLIGVVLFGWFNITLIRAANQAEVLVRDAYDTLSGIQSVEALLTQTEAVESMAIFNAQQALVLQKKADEATEATEEERIFQESSNRYREQANNFLSDADAYLFLLEQRLCGEPQLPNQPGQSCIDETFLDGLGISPQAKELAEAGKNKYGLRRNPLIVNAFSNNFEGEPKELDNLRKALHHYKEANQLLKKEIQSEQPISSEQREQSKNAYLTAINASINEQSIVGSQFNNIYSTVTLTMDMNWWLAFSFSGLGLLGAWGIRRRRKALFA